MRGTGLAIVNADQFNVSMPFAVEMYFDRGSEQRIRALSERCATLAGSTVTKETRPHISLSVADEINHEKIEELLVSFARRYKSFEITLSAIGFFAVTPSIAYLAPKVDQRLLELHAVFFGEFAEVAFGIWENYLPRSWIPHCTLVSGLDARQGALVLEEVQHFGLPAACKITEIGLIRFRPVVQIRCLGLTSSFETPNQSTDPKSASGTPDAWHQSRHP